MGKFQDMQASMTGKTGGEQLNEQLQSWAKRHNDRMTEDPSLWSSIIRWPMDKFTDYRTDRMLQFSPEMLEKKNQILKDVEPLYKDRVIDDAESNSDAYLRWKMLLRGKGV